MAAQCASVAAVLCLCLCLCTTSSSGSGMGHRFQAPPAYAHQDATGPTTGLQAPPLGGTGYLNVMDPPFKAAGDGKTDDTAAFQQALTAAGAQGGGIVLAPTGTYCIRGTLTVPGGVALSGSNAYPFRSWGQPGGTPMGTTLLAYSGKGNFSAAAFVSLGGANAGVIGLNVFYPEQLANATTPLVYPPAVRGMGADDLTVKNVLLVNPYFGIDFATHPSGRHFIEGVYGQPIYIGIQVDQCYDIGRIKQIHFWPFFSSITEGLCKWQHLNAISLDILRTDWEIVEDVFSFGYHQGIRFRKSAAGSCNGQFTDINFDDVDIGVDVYDTQEWGVFFNNLNVANAGDGQYKIGIRGNAGGQARVVVRGGSLWGAMKQGLVWATGGMVQVSDTLFNNWDKRLPAVELVAGRATLQGNAFHDAVGVAVHIGAGTDRVVVSGNDLVGNRIENEGKITLIANNLP